MILMEEFRQLKELLAKSPSTPVLIDKSVFTLADWQARDRGLQTLVGLLQTSYEVTAATEDSLLFAQRPHAELLHGGEKGAVIHAQARDGALLTGPGFGLFSTKPPWSMELVVKPAAVQGLYATLVGNHPGPEYSGFVIHEDAPGVCALIVGDGQAWQTILHFSLRPSEWNYLAVVRTADAFTVYVDGKLVASRITLGLEVKESPLELQIGNIKKNDRPFNGDFKEFRVLKRALAPDEIAAAAESLRGKLP